MIFLNEEIYSEENIELIKTEKELIYSLIIIQKNKTETILKYMQKYAYSADTSNLDSVNRTVQFLETLKATLELCNNNITNLNLCTNTLDNIIFSIQNNTYDIQKILKSFNTDYSILYKDIIDNTLVIENNMSNALNINIENEESKITQSSSEEVSSNNSSIETAKYQENTLIISETTQSVTLPYSISEIEEIMKKNPNKYSSIDKVILKKYTLPISIFKNPFISRFKEAFKLMRKREYCSVIESIDLGLELMFQSNLHPAIISACKTLDELDTYLDYLDSGKKDTFSCFKIIFETPPIAIRKKRNEF